MDKNVQGYVVIGTDIDLKGFEQKIDDLIKLLEKKGREGGKEFAKGLSMGFAVLNNVVSRIMGVISSSISGAISRTDTLNNFSLVMESLGVDSKDAAESIDYMSEKLLGLPTTLDEAAMAVKRFTSANNNVKASTEMFLALNNAILAGGAPMQQQSAALEQMSQAYAKGKPDMMEWRTILAAMPAQLNQVARAMNFASATELGEALRSGQVSMNDFMVTMVKLNKMEGMQSFAEQAKKGTGGIQTAVTNLKNAVVRAVSEVIQTIGHQNIAGFINNIKDAIVGLFPYIAAFVKTIMGAVAAIAKLFSAISGLFGKKSKKEVQDIAVDYNNVGYAVEGIGDNAKGAAGSAKKLKKELANLQGFDEMNVLQDKQDTGSGGGGASAGIGDMGNLGSFDTSGLDAVGGKIKELTASTEIFSSVVWGLVGAWIAFKTLKLLDHLELIDMTVKEMLTMAAGIGLIVGGVVLVIQGVLDYLKDPTWENFAKILGGIALIVAGVALIFGGIPALITAIILLVAALGLAIYKHWDEIKQVLEPVWQWIDEHIIQPIVRIFQWLWNTIKAIFSPVINITKSFLTTIWQNVKIAIDNMLSIVRPIFDFIKQQIDIKVQQFKAFVSVIKSIFEPLKSFFKGIIDFIWNMIKSIGSTAGQVIAGAFKSVVNAILTAIESILNTPIKAINELLNIINTVPGINLKKLKTFNLPRLAKGGIINMPGRGVPIGSAIGGERGREGVIPLTDSQQMALLGEAIGKYININATVPVYVGNRQIARELKKIEAENDFAYNR